MTSFFIYARKSTESDDRQALSIEAQLNELKQLAKREGLHISKIFTESQSAKNSDRPVFKKMIGQLKKNQISGLLCWKLDRLTRNLLDAAKISDLLEKGVISEIKTPVQTYRNNSIDRLMSGIDFLFARKFIDDLSENVKRGLRMKVQQGWMPGRPPVGYLSDQGDKGFRTIIPDPERFPLIRKMWDIMLEGNHSVPQVLNVANNQWGFRTRKTRRMASAPLSKSALYKIFNDPFYYGRFYFQGEYHKGRHKPMVSEEEFNRVQFILGSNDRPKSKKQSFALTGLFHCEQCKSSITAERKYKLIKSTNLRKSYVYYHCTHGKDRNCRQGSITESNLMDQIDKCLSEISIPQVYLDWIFKYYDLVFNKEEDKTKSEKLSIKKELNAIDQKLQNLFNLKISPKNDANQLMSDEEFLKQKAHLTEEKQNLHNSLKSYNQRCDKEVLKLTKETFELATYSRVWFREGDTKRKRTIIKSIFSNRAIIDKNVLMIANKPFELISKFRSQAKPEVITLEPLELGLHNRKSTAYNDGLSVLLRRLDDIRTEIRKMVMENDMI